MSAIDVVTLVLAVVGAVTGVASLVWAVIAHRQSGVQAEVELRYGLLTGAGYVSYDPMTKHDPRPPTDFAGDPVFSVTVKNTGRLPLIVGRTSIDAGKAALTAIQQHPLNPALPHTIDVSSAASWFYPAADVDALAAGVSDVFGEKALRLRAVGQLANDQRVDGEWIDANQALRRLRIIARVA